MNKAVKFDFSIGQDVWVKPLELQCRIMARCDRGGYHEYRVIYWAEGTRRDEWLLAHELGETR